MVVAGGWGEWDGESAFDRVSVSVWEDEVLDVDGGGGCATTRMCSVPLAEPGLCPRPRLSPLAPRPRLSPLAGTSPESTPLRREARRGRGSGLQVAPPHGATGRSHPGSTARTPAGDSPPRAPPRP